VAAGEFTLQLSDMELARAAADGDAHAFRALTDRHIEDLFRLALSLSGRRADAEDICQETLVGAFKGVRRFDGRSSFKTWITRILLRQASRTWKKNRQRTHLPIEAIAGGLPAAAANQDARLDLLDVMKQLGPEHQQIIVLRELHGLSYEEISQAAGIPCGTVESRLFRARMELRKLLKDYQT
jgi:RNA polymerase sigma-70 factor (ECF subfamily)